MPFYRSIVRQTAFVWAFLVVFAPLAAHADHHRGGRISWQRIDDTHAQINFQITFKRLVNTAGASGIGGYPRLNDNIRDPLSNRPGFNSDPRPAPPGNPPPASGLPYTVLVIGALDHSATFGRFAYNWCDNEQMHVIDLREEDVVCIPASPVTVAFPTSGRYLASLYMWRRAEESVAGGDGFFNRPITMSVVETIIDLAKPGAQSPHNTPPSFSQALPTVIEFQANQILNDGNGQLTAGATLTPPSFLPFQIADQDVILGNPNSDILRFKITNEAADEVPGLTINRATGVLAWDPADLLWNPGAPAPDQRSKRKQTCGVWNVTVRVSDYAAAQDPDNPASQPKSSTELEFLLRINEPTLGVPSLSLKDDNGDEYQPGNDPIDVTVPAGVLARLATFDLTDPDPFALVSGEVVSGGSRIFFDPGGSCSPATGAVVFASTLADAGQPPFLATVRGRDDDGHVTPGRSFRITVTPPADAPLSVTLTQCINGDVGFQEIPRMRVLLPMQEFDFFILGIRMAPEGPSSIPLVLSSSWQFPPGIPQVLPLPPGATVRPALPLGGIPNPFAAFHWQPTAADIGVHLITFAVSDGLGHVASASVTIDVRAFTVTVSSPFNVFPDSLTGVIRIDAWNDFLRATLTALDSSYVISFGTPLPRGVSASVPGNSATVQWRAMGVQFGRNLIPVHVAAGAQSYDGNLIVDVGQTEPSWWRIQNPAQGQFPVRDQDLPQYDYAMANQGQVKHIARMAALAIQVEIDKATMNQTLFLISQGQVDTLLGFTGNFSNSKNFLPWTQGQVKLIAEKFHDVFRSSGVLFPSSGQATFPWSSLNADDVDYAPVNIGQVKALFGFDPSQFYVSVDAGPFQIISGAPAVAILSGNVNSSRENLTVMWTADAQNPFATSIANPSQWQTAVSISTLGDYAFHLTVTGANNYTASATVYISIQ